MNRFTIKSRLAGLVAVVLALLLVLATLNVLRMREANDVIRTLYEDRVVCLRQLKAVSDAFGLTIATEARRAADGREQVADARRAILEAQKAASKEWADYIGTYLDPTEQQLVATAKPHLAAADAATTRFADALRADTDLAALRELASGTLRPAIDPLVADVNHLVQRQLDVAQQLYEDSQSRYQAMLWRTSIATVIVVAALAAFAWALIASILKPLAQAVHVAETVATGDLSVTVRVVGRDETAQLSAALARMATNLQGIVAEVRDSSESIATGSSQIATGNADLSQRTEEQASNLQQTAASMEQLTATVQHNAATARTVRDLAAGAADAATRGGEVVARVIETMGGISDASRRIQDIIGVIDGIAFQTNILALNAAVEAARAGEHGRGFAVVAGEVRTLAQRSSTAAREVRTLIGTSVERVDAGGALVGEAGSVMGDIVTRVSRVTQLVGEISAASDEQSGGIGQIGDAVQQLDQVTQQNAALVEESAAAAESLKQQAARLSEVVGTFRL